MTEVQKKTSPGGWLQKGCHFWQRFQSGVMLGLFVVLAGLATWQFLRVTANKGVFLTTDSINYFWAAENVADGRGFGRLTESGEFRQITHWPPLYPLLLVSFAASPLGAEAGARLLGAVIFFLLLVFIGITLWRMTRSGWLSLLTTVLLAAFPAFWRVNMAAMTEPLYILCGLVGAIWLDRYLRRQDWLSFGLAAFFMACALLTRYVAPALIASACVLLLFAPGWTFKRRFWRAMLFGAVSALPLGLWLLYNQLQAGNAVNRPLALNPMPLEEFEWFFVTLQSWTFPVQSIFWVGLLKVLLIFGGAGVVLLVCWLRRKGFGVGGENAEKTSLPLFYLIYLLAYPLVVLFSRLFVDVAIPIYRERIIFPLLLTVVFLLAWLVKRAFAGLMQRLCPAAALLVVLILISVWTALVQYQPELQAHWQQTLDTGTGVENMKGTPLAQAVQAIPQDHMIITDILERTWYISGRMPFQLNAFDDYNLAMLEKFAAEQPVTFVLLKKYDWVQPLQNLMPDLAVTHQDSSWIILSCPGQCRFIQPKEEVSSP